MAKASVLPKASPLAVPDLDIADRAAIKAVYRGDATPEMQQRAFDCILKKICLLGGIVFSEKGNDITNFMAGRRFPAVFLIDIIRTDSPSFDKPN
jgi:hypothetical protein